MDYILENLIRSPLNYSGNKFKLLTQLIPLFPDSIDIFVDLFGGAFNVGINIEANKIIYNEANLRIFSLIKDLCEKDFEDIKLIVLNILNKYGLSKNNKNAYINLRSDYNNTKDIMSLFVLSCFSYNNQIRFNNKDEFNVPCGKQSYNQNTDKLLRIFNEVAKHKNLCFMNNDFQDIYIEDNHFVYCDPPYLQTINSYINKYDWNIRKEEKMYEYLDNLNSQSIKFALSNTLFYQGNKNEILYSWARKYNVNELNFQYKNNRGNRTREIGFTQEILITNY